MAQRHDYWTHGIATVLESPQLAQLVQHRSDIGTVIEQAANTGAWFHIPIPTPSVLAGDTTISLRDFALVATVNDNAKVDLLHLRRGKDLVYNKGVSFVATLINQTFGGGTLAIPTSAGGSSGCGITLSVHVAFLSGTPRGRVEFHGAGAIFS